MPQSVDGDIRISVEIDDSGITKGAKDIRSIMSGVSRSMGKFGKEISSAYSQAAVDVEKYSIKLAKAEEEVKKQEIAVQKLQDKLDALKNGDVTPQSLEKMDAKIAKAEKKFDELIAKMDAAKEKVHSLSIGAEWNPDLDKAKEEYAQLAEQVANAGGKLDAMKAKAEAIRLNPQNSAESVNISRDLDKANATLERMKIEASFAAEGLEHAKEAAKDTKKEIKQTPDALKKTNKEIKQIPNALKKTNSAAKRFKSLIASVFVFNVFRKGLNSLRDSLGSALKTNTQFSDSVAKIKGNLLTAFAPIYEAVLPAINAMMSTLERATASLAGFFAALSGKALAETAKDAEELYKQTTATEKSLASFDEINKISNKETEDAITPDFSGITENTEIIEKTASLAERIKQAFSSVGEWFEKTWIPTISQAFDRITPSFDSIKAAFPGIFADAQTLADPIANLFNNSIIPFIQQSLLNISTIVSGWISTLSVILSGVWNTAVYPVLTTLITTVYPFITNLFGRIGEVATQIFGTLAPLIEDVFVGGIMPALSLLSTVFDDLWTGIADAYDKWAAPIFDGFRLAIENIGTILSNAWHNLIKPIWESVVSALTEIWNDHLKPLWNNILDFVGELVNCALTIYNNAIAPIVQWIQENLYPVIVKAAQSIIERVKIIVNGVIDAVSGIITWLKGIIQFITGVFSGDWEKAWNGIKTAFQGIWESLSAIIKTPINLIIQMINGMLEAVIGGINKVISAVNSLYFDVPDWVPGIGGKTFGFDLKELSIPQIPLLAQGAVIPANQPFLSILGDQRNGTNIETPLSTMIDAFNTALDARGDSGRQEAILEIDGEKFGRLIYKLNKKESKRVGVNFAEG